MAQPLALKPGSRTHSRRKETAITESVLQRDSATLVLIAALLLLTFLAYLPVLQAGFIWDDDDYVTENLTLRSLDGLRQIWFELGATPQYYPLVHTTFWIEYHLWGLAPAGYHITNVLLHGASAVLLWALLARLAVPGAWLAAALFAVHPVHVESVAWITERKNVLSGLLYLGALWSLLRFLALKGEESFSGFAGAATRFPFWNSRSGCYAAALLLFIAALLSKTVTFTLPAAVLVLLWWKRGHLSWRDFAPLLPFFAAGAALGLVTVWMEKHNVGAQGSEWALKPAERWLVSGRALWFYAEKLLWPYPLVFIYPRWKLDSAAVWQHLFPAAVLVTIAALWLVRRQTGRAPLAAVLLFAGTLFPALGFFDVYPMRYSFVADHFQYLASIPLLTLAAAGMVRALGAVPPRVRTACTLVLLAGLGILTARQCYVYRDLETLWRDTLAKNPAAGIAHNNLGNLLTERGDFAAADRHYGQAIALDPRDDFAHYNHGVSLLRQGRAQASVAHLRKALELNREYVDAYFNLGKALDETGRSAEAVRVYQQGLRLRPQDARGHAALAVALVNLNRGAEAAAEYRRSIELDPTDPDTHFNFAALLTATEQHREAAAHFETALKLRPGDVEAHQALAEIYQRLGDRERSRLHLDAATSR